MLRHAPAHIFNNLANHPNTGVGVFSSAEKIVVYPEYQYLADYPACYGKKTINPPENVRALKKKTNPNNNNKKQKRTHAREVRLSNERRFASHSFQ